ncbi:4-hydroxy-tetrahydrodipicolinate synthase [Solihabitans fulvus]|uniref:4-hydroxy-tetrahydrodipicolinate synthase n=1 Tax=Solihabitans fulvus TaxID=1892852 RepID=A0A5B2WPH1_9PSEU|nr:4-hydroxy-tetrahydrodipicolinate synthase [Solihabitans fulvus]KAA2253853.1 4-hydroxy-tetrahydrodipicolinate synthase [Solihabitans fulvus]
MTPGLHGIHVPLITPMTADGAIDPDALAALANRVLDDGATGLVALGTTAETATLTDTERHTVLDICADVCRDRAATLTVGAGSNDTHATADALRALTRWPRATAALVPVPYFNRPAEAGVIAHFTHLAKHSPVPIVIYNVPYRTGQTITAATLRHLAALPAIVGVKHAVGGIDQDTITLLADPPADFAVLAGDDAYLSPLLAIGAAGGILASAHLRTRDFVDLATAWRTGDLPTARATGHRLAALSTALFAEPNPAVIKAVLHAQGHLPSPAVRLPLLPASPAALRAALQHA